MDDQYIRRWNVMAIKPLWLQHRIQERIKVKIWLGMQNGGTWWNVVYTRKRKWVFIIKVQIAIIIEYKRAFAFAKENLMKTVCID